MESYIGVTGFMSRAEVLNAIATFDNLERDHARSRRLLMVGALVSSKTLAGGTNKYPKRYPSVDKIASIFPPDRRTLNLIHYATDDRETLGDQLEQLVQIGGRYLDGFQLNIAWPEPYMLSTFVQEYDLRIVLQIGRQAFEQCGDDAEKAADRVLEYEGCVSHVLLDMSGGKGVAMDPEKTREVVGTFFRRLRSLMGMPYDVGIGIAGGLEAKNLELVRELAKDYPDLCIDAEGRLRNAADELHFGAVDAYLREADAIFRT